MEEQQRHLARLQEETRLLKDLLRGFRSAQNSLDWYLKNQTSLVKAIRAELEAALASLAAPFPPVPQKPSSPPATEALHLLRSMGQSLAAIADLNKNMRQCLGGAQPPWEERPSRELSPVAPSPPNPATTIARSRDLTRELLDSTSNYLVIVNRDLVIEACNSAWADSLRAHPRQIVGGSLKGRLPPAIMAQLQDAMARCLESRAPETVLVSTSGGVHEWSIHPILSPDGEVQKLALAANEITKYYEEQQRRQEYLLQYETVFEHTADIILIHDADGRILQMNQAGRRLLGLTHGVEPGSMGDVLCQDLASYLDQFRDGQSFRDIVVEFRTPSGRRLPCEMNVCKITHEHTPALLCIGRDNSEVCRLETYLAEAQRAMEINARVKNEFLANISHELRTPLSAIIGFSELVADGPLDKTQRFHIERVLSSADMLRGLINDLLDISRLEAGVLSIQAAPFNIIDLMNEIKATFLLKAAQKNIGFHFDIEKDIPPLLVGDVLRLRQILLNLVGNAIKFTEQGAVGITVAKAEVDEFFEGAPRADAARQIWVHFSVMDSGIGIQERDAQRIFQRFVQVEGSESRPFEGTGLGLTISKNLVELMGGSIWVKSRPGQGSTFHFMTPLLHDPALALPATGGDVPALSPMVILLVEDNEFNREMIQAMLVREGHVLRFARDGLEALEMLRSFLPDLVLMDLQMPRCDGFEATRRIRSHPNPRVAALPIFALSAHGQDDVAAKCLSLGMSGFLAKPFRYRELCQALQTARSGGEPPPANAPARAAPAEAARREPSDPDALPRLDIAVLRATCNDDPAFMRHACRRFLEHASRLRQELDQAVQAADGSTTRRLAHTLKSVCAAVGGKRAAAQALALERMADGNAPWEACRGARRLLADEVEALRAHIRAFLHQDGPEQDDPEPAGPQRDGPPSAPDA